MSPTAARRTWPGVITTSSAVLPPLAGASACSLHAAALPSSTIEQGTNAPIKAKFYSDSGRLLKILYYRGYQQQLDGVRPLDAIIIDAVDKSLATVATSSDYAYLDIPDTWFQRDYLPHLETR